MEKEEKELKDFSMPELSDHCTELWFNFGAATGKEKKAIREQYNAAAHEYNKRAGWKCMSFITDATQVSPPPAERIASNQEPYPPPSAGRKGLVTQEIIEEDLKKPRAKKSALPISAPTAKSASIAAPKSGSITEQIVALHVAGKTNAEIVAAGYNKSTVARQVSEYKKRTTK